MSSRENRDAQQNTDAVQRFVVGYIKFIVLTVFCVFTSLFTLAMILT